MMSLAGHSEIENEIDTFLENFRKNGAAFSAPLGTQTYAEKIRPSRSFNSKTAILTNFEESETQSPSSPDSSKENVDNQTTTSLEDDDDIMDEVGCAMTVHDVADLLRAQYAIITGGKARDGCPIITFPDTGNFCNLAEDDYRRLIVYLTSVPTLQDADLGFVIIVDRRTDKWNSVKTTLLKIAGFFPGLIQVVFVLRPASFFQKAIGEVSNKIFKEEFKFKVVVCGCSEELQEHLDRNQLTEDLDGCIPYRHEEWIHERIAVEKFNTHTQEVAHGLRNFIQRLQETELPNDVLCTQNLLRIQSSEFAILKEELRTVTAHGDDLLTSLRGKTYTSLSNSDPRPPCSDNKLLNVTAVERLLVQLEETEKGFDDFWQRHQEKLHQCLDLRRFEHEFRESQANLDTSLKILSDMTELGDSVARVDVLLQEALEFEEECNDDLEKAIQLKQMGERLINSKHYAIDCVAPKCLELQRMCDDLNEKIHKRTDSLRKYRELQERVEKANKWCKRGVDLLASLQIDKCVSPEFAETALHEIEDFLLSSSEFKLNNPREFHNIFKDMITPDTNALVQQVLKRIEDVQIVCEKRKVDLKKLSDKPQRPVQPVVPEPAIPLLTPPRSPQPPSYSEHHSTSPTPSTSSSSSGLSPKCATEFQKPMKKVKTVPKVFSRLGL